MSHKTNIRSCYDGTRVKYALSCKTPSHTIQEHTEGCDINNILNRFTNGQLIDHLSEHEGEYNDFKGFDYLENLNKVKRFESIFESLPARSKSKFNNEPSQFLDFIQDQRNIEDMRDGEIDNFISQSTEKNEKETLAETAKPPKTDPKVD